jgi:hypothetical protein
VPTEYYVGIAIALILIALLGLLFRPRRDTRRVVQQKHIETDQMATQLSRIADSLEILVAHLGASPSAEKLPVERPVVQERFVEKRAIQEPPAEKLATEEPPIPLENAVQTADTNDTTQGKVDPPPERHVRLSMFGR